MNYKNIKRLQKGDFVTVKTKQRTYYDGIYIVPGDLIEVNNANAPYVFHVPGNKSGFLAGFVIRNGENVPCGVAWDNVAIL